MTILRRALVGFVAGALATVPMTGEFLLARRAGFLDEVPPHKAIRSVTESLPEPRLTVTSGLAHLGVGAAAGAAYAAVLPTRLQGPLTGIAAGLVVWLIGYEAVMPAATNIEPAHRDRRDRASTILVAHVIFGLGLGLLSRRIAQSAVAVTRSSAGR